MRDLAYRGNWTTDAYAVIDKWVHDVEPDVIAVALVGMGVRVERTLPDGRPFAGMVPISGNLRADLHAALADLDTKVADAPVMGHPTMRYGKG